MDLTQSYNFNPYSHMNGVNMGMNVGFMMNSSPSQYMAKDIQNGVNLNVGRGIVDYYHSCKSKYPLLGFIGSLDNGI